QQFQYEFRIPANHPAGTYWYHPHHHGDSAAQVNAGLAGAIIIEGGLDQTPGVRGLPERLFLLQAPSRLDRTATPITVNGKIGPVFSLAPGATERWRLINASATEFIQISVSGHALNLIAIDGNALSAVRSVTSYLLPPGGRIEALVRTQSAGSYAVSMLPWGRRPRSQTLATMNVAGAPVTAAPLPTTLATVPSLASATVAARRTFEFQLNRNGMPVSINDLVFDMNRVDVTAALGSVEEWTLRNPTLDTHPFHIHVNAFQVMRINGVAQPVTWMDTVPLPPKGEVVIRIPFADFTGKSVFHCHLLNHEDQGMMMMFEVVPPAVKSAAVACANLDGPRRAACRRDRRTASRNRSQNSP
ncbi:MAG: multicopper oxidase family protein, partial [Thermomicrobiales bacterium]